MSTTQTKFLQKKFTNLKVDNDWCFGNERKTEWTHDFHRYPAKFIPQIVKKLIEKYTQENDLIVDVFAGCGTTLVESKIHGRKSIGVDINPVATLITDVKINPISPDRLSEAIQKVKSDIKKYSLKQIKEKINHQRIDYWFRKKEKRKITFLYKLITKVDDEKIENFLLCALSNILKNCSKWLQSSTKPQIDPIKEPSDPFESFIRQLAKMEKKNEIFYEELKKNKFLNKQCKIKLKDARKTGIKKNTVDMIITSPPYVTSYEYADIHQLTGYWFEYIDEIKDFRKDFIGTFYSNNKKLETKSKIAKKIIDELEKKNLRVAREVAKYFNDMYDVAKEMKRILKKDGRACLVIGNTTFKEVKIESAEIFSDFLLDLGFEIEKIIKRSIPFKFLPTIRDKKTGRFTNLKNKNSKMVYPEEYIIITKLINF